MGLEYANTSMSAITYALHTPLARQESIAMQIFGAELVESDESTIVLSGSHAVDLTCSIVVS